MSSLHMEEVNTDTPQIPLQLITFEARLNAILSGSKQEAPRTPANKQYRPSADYPSRQSRSSGESSSRAKRNVGRPGGKPPPRPKVGEKVPIKGLGSVATKAQQHYQANPQSSLPSNPRAVAALNKLSKQLGRPPLPPLTTLPLAQAQAMSKFLTEDARKLSDYAQQDDVRPLGRFIGHLRNKYSSSGDIAGLLDVYGDAVNTSIANGDLTPTLYMDNVVGDLSRLGTGTTWGHGLYYNVNALGLGMTTGGNAAQQNLLGDIISDPKGGAAAGLCGSLGSSDAKSRCMDRFGKLEVPEKPQVQPSPEYSITPSGPKETAGGGGQARLAIASMDSSSRFLPRVS